MNAIKAAITKSLNGAGLQVNGPRPIDPQIHDKRFYSRVFFEGTLGLGESYVDGQWDCENLPGAISVLLQTGTDKGRAGLTGVILETLQKFTNAQSVQKSRRVGERHYDIGNDLYSRMLDPRLVYTCGYWENATTLAQAQEDKMDLVCRKLRLKPGQKILDVGCGWGSFAKFAAEKYGVEVVGITISKEQLTLGQKLCEGLPVDLRFLDYRHLPQEFPPEYFDHIVSIGMFEAVGPKNFRTFMEVLSSLVKKDGFFLLHTIGGNDIGGFEAWIERYIFAGGWIPSLAEIVKSVKDRFIIEDLHNFGAYYDLTLCAWWDNFDAAWPELKATGKYDERFYRMWRYYLSTCAAGFRSRRLQLYQFVLSPNGVPGGYKSIR